MHDNENLCEQSAISKAKVKANFSKLSEYQQLTSSSYKQLQLTILAVMCSGSFKREFHGGSHEVLNFQNRLKLGKVTAQIF